MAQETEEVDGAPQKQKELGLAFSNFDRFGVTFKIGNEKALWRFNSLHGSGDKDKDERDNGTDYITKENSVSIGIGREFRRSVSDKFVLRYGLDVKYSYSVGKRESKGDTSDYFNSKRNSHSFGGNIVLGVNYMITKQLIFGAEILPGFNYYKGKGVTEYPSSNDEKTSEISGYSYGF